jgi:hypothetical protein
LNEILLLKVDIIYNFISAFIVFNLGCVRDLIKITNLPKNRCKRVIIRFFFQVFSFGQMIKWQTKRKEVCNCVVKCTLFKRGKIENVTFLGFHTNFLQKLKKSLVWNIHLKNLGRHIIIRSKIKKKILLF